MAEALGWAASLIGFVGTLILISERGFRDGMRMAWFLATLAVPGWFTVGFRSVALDAITGMSLATFVAMLRQPFHGKRSTWMLSDLLLVAVVIVAIVSDAFNRVLIPGTVLELIRSWVFPYLIGRLFLTTWDGIDRVLPTVMILGAALSGLALFESIFQLNLLALATGKRWDILETGEGFRWGLKRAHVITNHPIYFGLLICMTLPWLLVGARASMNRQGPRWWIAVPYLAVAAAFATVSRSAQLTVLIVLAADQFFRRPAFRIPMLLIAVIGGIMFLLFRQQILDLLGSYAGESDTTQDRVRIYGVEYDYTGTRHRDLLVLAYEDAIDRAGWLGFGTAMQDMPKDPYMDPRFLSIDFHYLIHFLKYGYLGIATFAAFAIAVMWNLAREAWTRAGPTADLAAGLFGAFVAVAIMLRGVAFSFDFAATWLFVAGLSASLRARRVSGTTPVS
jgi:hypothetical protein